MAFTRLRLKNFKSSILLMFSPAGSRSMLDQLPLAGDEEIKVSLEEPSLKPELVKSDGSLTWKIPLKAAETKELRFGILVEYPKDREINGL